MSTEEVSAGRLDVTRLTVEEAARLLGVERKLIEEDIEEGAPVGPDGTLDLVHYGAWLNLCLKEAPDGVT